MSGDHNLTAIVVVLVILLLAVIGAVSVTRFIVRSAWRLFARTSSQSVPEGTLTPVPKEADSEIVRHTPDGESLPACDDPGVATSSTGSHATSIPACDEPDLVAEETHRTRNASSVRSHTVRMSSDPRLVGHESPVAPWGGGQDPRRIREGDHWVPGDGNARVAGRDIGGMVYVGRAPRTRPGGYPDNAFIDPDLDVGRHGQDHEGAGLHYWPSYSTIDPRARATYLDWLADGRSGTGFDAGYVFLYFYGLERRVFVDNAEAWERGDIIAEVRRLLDTYGDNNSIRRYLEAFIDAARLLDDGFEPRPVFRQDGHGIPTEVLIGLGRMAARGEPLDADWLLSWYVCHPDTNLRTPARRAFREFKEYFGYLFEDEFPDGLKLRNPKRTLKLTYHASSGSFKADLSDYLDDVPDVTSLKSPLVTARAIARLAYSGLDKYSRFLGRNPDGRGTIEAHALLPEGIWSLFPCPEKEDLRQWVASRINAGGMTPVEDVMEQLEGSRPAKIGKRQLIDLADALARLGIGMAPDPRFALRQPKLGEPVMLFELPEGILAIDSPTEAYRRAILKLAVGSFIAHSDGRIDSAEQDHMAARIDANRSVIEAERARLHANLAWMIAVPPDLNMLRNQFRDTSESVRRALGQLAAATAGSDGIVSREEIRSLEKLYSSLGLDRDLVYTDLHSLTSSSEPVIVRPGIQATDEFAIPLPPEEAPPGGVELDEERISSVMSDTVRVSQVLGQVFADDEDAEGEDDENIVPGEEDRFDGLDPAHRAVASVLMTRQEWTEEEVASLASEHQLMVAGMIETINEWAYEKFGDALVEHYGDYEVNGELTHLLMH